MSAEPHLAEAFREPTDRVGRGYAGAFALAWLGIWMAQLVPYQLLVPDQVQRLLPADAPWQDSVIAFGIISGIGGLVALIAYPLAGAASDRTASRFGRRRPWIFGGALVFAAGLVALGFAQQPVAVAAGWAVVSVGFCLVTAPLTATISDRVPVEQRGAVGAWISAPQAVGSILGLLIVQFVFTGQQAAYASLAVMLVVLVLPITLRGGDPVIPRSARPSLRTIIAGFWISPRAHPDFAWTLAGRILVNVGNALGTGLLFYFLEFGLGRADPTGDLLIASLVYTVFVVAAAFIGGRISDRAGRRRIFVLIASLLIAVGSTLIALLPVFEIDLVGAAILGIGYGAFLAVDQALATQVLPDPADRGKDLGIMNIATAVPQALAPLGGAFVVAWLGGFTGLYLLAGITALLGALCVLPVRSVR